MMNDQLRTCVPNEPDIYMPAYPPWLANGSIGDEASSNSNWLSLCRDSRTFTQFQDDFCRHFACCGLSLHDLHVLNRHFEEAHAATVEPSVPYAYEPDVHDTPTLHPSTMGTSPSCNYTNVTRFDVTSSDSSAHISHMGSHASVVPGPYSRPGVPDQFNLAPPDMSTVSPVACATERGHIEPPVVHGVANTSENAILAGMNAISPSESEPVQSGTDESTVPATPSSSPKQYRCTKPDCNKSYKQANGLKYHLTYGTCSIGPAQASEAMRTLLAERGVTGSQDLPEHVTHAKEMEAELRLRPYACTVGDCTRRYKNLAGLKYHYMHTGLHGVDGLLLLASGQHQCFPLLTGRGHRSISIQAVQAVEALHPPRNLVLESTVHVEARASRKPPQSPLILS